MSRTLTGFRLLTRMVWGRDSAGARWRAGAWRSASAWPWERIAVRGGALWAIGAGGMRLRRGAGVATAERRQPTSMASGAIRLTPERARRGRIRTRGTSAQERGEP